MELSADKDIPVRGLFGFLLTYEIMSKVLLNQAAHEN